jgi:hypothetical protein
VWVHDYHLIPLAEELRALGLTNRIGYFHHIPWPAPEVLGTLPGSKELLSSIASYDLIGVQTERDGGQPQTQPRRGTGREQDCDRPPMSGSGSMLVQGWSGRHG